MVCCPPRTTWLCLPLPTFLHSASSHSPHHEEQSSIAELQLSLSFRTHLHSYLTLSVHRNVPPPPPPRPPTPLSVSFSVPVCQPVSVCLSDNLSVFLCLSVCIRSSPSFHPLPGFPRQSCRSFVLVLFYVLSNAQHYMLSAFASV